MNSPEDFNALSRPKTGQERPRLVESQPRDAVIAPRLPLDAAHCPEAGPGG